MTHVLAIDQGTTNSKALLLDKDGCLVSRGSARVPIAYPRAGWVEQSADDIWRSTQEAIATCLAAAPGIKVAAIGVTNQRETVAVWDAKTGKPLAPCVSWQCQRAVDICEDLKSGVNAQAIIEKTGLPLDPMFSAGKMAWLLQNIDGLKARAENGDVCIGTIDSWLVWKLTGGAAFVTDASNASRTLLMNIEAGDWDHELTKAFGIPLQSLPAIKPSSGVLGETAGFEGCPAGIPVTAAAGDSHAALFGHRSFSKHAVKATYGTGSSLMMLSDADRPAALSKTIAWRLGENSAFALEGNISATGAAVDWAARLAQQDGSAPEIKLDSADGVYLVPAFTGLAAPHWNNHARATLCGMTFGATVDHIMRAAMESIAYQVADVFTVMEQADDNKAAELLADGGATRNDALMQFQADIIDRPVIRNRHEDLSAYGAGLLAGLAVNVWQDLAELESLPGESDRYEPQMPASQRAALIEGWQDAVARATMAPSNLGEERQHAPGRPKSNGESG